MEANGEVGGRKKVVQFIKIRYRMMIIKSLSLYTDCAFPISFATLRMLQEKLNEPVSAPPSPRDALMLDDGAVPPIPTLNTSGNANLNTRFVMKNESCFFGPNVS